MLRKSLIALAALAALGAGASAANAKTHININFGFGGFGGYGPYDGGYYDGGYPYPSYDCGYELKFKKIWISPGHAIFVQKKVWVCG